MIIVGVAILSCLLIGLGYAYYIAHFGDAVGTDANLTSHKTDKLTFITGNELTIKATQQNFAEGGNNLTGETTSFAKLVANNTNNTASDTYNGYVVVKDNTFKYNRGTEAEILINVYDPQGNEVTTSEGLSYVTVDGVSGFDVTEVLGAFQIASEYAISTNSSTDGTTQEWKIKVTYLNKDYDQSFNEKSVIEIELFLQKGEYVQDAIAIYSEDDSSLRFYQASTALEAGDTYNGLLVTNVYKDFIDKEYNADSNPAPWIDTVPWVVSFEDTIKPNSIQGWFTFLYAAEYFIVDKLDVSNVTDLSSVFIGISDSSFSGNPGHLVIEGLETWDTSKVTDMSNMFDYVGNGSSYINIEGLGAWDTSNVTDMSGMFSYLGSDFETDRMYNLEVVIDGLDNWDTSSVTDMSSMFTYSGGKYTNLWDVGDLSNWDTSNVTNMKKKFYETARGVDEWSIGDLSSWDTSSVTDMSYMFYHAGSNAVEWNIGDLSKWNVSNVTDMSHMFNNAAYNATVFMVGDISTWNTSKVTNMSHMFNYCGHNINYSLDLSGWQVPLVTSYTNFNSGVESKVTAPTWVN